MFLNPFQCKRLLFFKEEKSEFKGNTQLDVCGWVDNVRNKTWNDSSLVKYLPESLGVLCYCFFFSPHTHNNIFLNRCALNLHFHSVLHPSHPSTLSDKQHELWEISVSDPVLPWGTLINVHLFLFSFLCVFRVILVFASLSVCTFPGWMLASARCYGAWTVKRVACSASQPELSTFFL